MRTSVFSTRSRLLSPLWIFQSTGVQISLLYKRVKKKQVIFLDITEVSITTQTHCFPILLILAFHLMQLVISHIISPALCIIDCGMDHMPMILYSDTCVPCTLYLQTVVCTVDLGTCDCFEMVTSDFLDLFKSIMCSFRSMLSSLDFPIVAIVAESNNCIKQAPLKWAHKSHQLLSIRITQCKFRGHFNNQQNWLFKLLYLYFWSNKQSFRRLIIN